MRRRVALRIILYLLLNCTAFVLLSAMQFTRRGNFSQRVGDMLISGRYFLDGEIPEGESRRLLDGGASVFFGGLEFRMLALPDSDAGIVLIGASGERRQVVPETFTATESEAVFFLPGGAELSFASQGTGGPQRGMPELRISGKFPRGVSTIDVPFRPQRSSVARDSDRGTFSISYNSGRYQFSRSQQGLEEGRLVLSPFSPAITYLAVTSRPQNNPADFIVQQAGTAESFSTALNLWKAISFEGWGRSMSPQADEDMVVAWCAEALRRGGYRAAASTIPAAFSTNPGRTWESSVYQFDRRVGVWERAVRAISEQEREKTNRITRLIAGKNVGIFAESRVIEFLAVREQGRLIDDLAALTQGIDPFEVTLAASCGIFESFTGMASWRPRINNPFEALAETASRLVAEGLYRWEDRVLVFSDGLADAEFNLRLGMALHEWGERSGKEDWAALGRSLALSVISLVDDGAVPAMLSIGPKGEFVPAPGSPSREISSARLYRLLGGNDHLPRTVATGAGGIQAWTVATSVNITQNDQHMDINISFPVGETHYIALRNVRPFPLLQIYETNWRRASDFEGYYDSSGWYYFESERTLVVKMRHRTNVERVRILFTVPAPPPPPPPPPEAPAAQETPSDPPHAEPRVDRATERVLENPYERPYERLYERMVD